MSWILDSEIKIIGYRRPIETRSMKILGPNSIILIDPYTPGVNVGYILLCDEGYEAYFVLTDGADVWYWFSQRDMCDSDLPDWMYCDPPVLPELREFCLRELEKFREEYV